MESRSFDLHWIDYALVAAYFVGIMLHGVYVSRKAKQGAEGYFLAGRALPWYLIGFSLFASNMSGSSFVGLIGGTYENGVAMFNYEWTAAFVLILFAVFILPSYLRARLSTVPEYLERRYDVRSRRAFSLFTILAVMFIDTAGALYAGGLVISSAIGFPLWQAVAVLALVAGIYTILGGLSAVVVTDTVQAILLIIGAAIIFWLGLEEVGGWESLFSDLDNEMTHLVLPADDDFLPWTGLWGVILLGFYYWTINQFVVQRTLGSKNLNAGRVGSVFAGFLKMPGLFLMILPGLIALKLFPELETPDLAFPTLAFELMPVGIRGIIMAALIAAIMSSLDSALNSAGTLVTLDFVKPLKPDLGERTYVAIGRTVTGLVMVFGAIYAPMIQSFESLFEYFQSSLSYIVAPIVVVYILGLFVPRLNGTGAFWTVMFGLVIGIPLFVVKEVFELWGAAELPEIHYTVMSSLMMFAAIGLHVGLSLATRRPDPGEIEAVVWDGADFRDEFLSLASPWYADYKLYAAALLLAIAGFMVWLW